MSRAAAARMTAVGGAGERSEDAEPHHADARQADPRRRKSDPRAPRVACGTHIRAASVEDARQGLTRQVNLLRPRQAAGVQVYALNLLPA